MESGFDLGRRSVIRWAEQGGGEEFRPAEEKYAVEAPIGRGGMGEVFLVTDQDLQRQVAMKVLRSEGAQSREAKLHFVAEAQATSQLEHPGIPPVHDIGITEDGRIYFTMKLVRGRTLREVLHDLLLKRREVQEEYSLHKLVSVLERIAETMHFAHERGAIHRDLKPENVMLGDYGEVHVMDWGLARIEAQSAHELEKVETARTGAGVETQVGAVKGTLPYMSPEQALGQADLDRRTDLYALGCILYEVLTLQPAFEPGRSDLVARVVRNDYPPVLTRNRRRPVPEALAAICTKAMAGAREERQASARELAEELRGWLDGRREKERRHQEAERLAAQGREAAGRYRSLHDEAEAAGVAAAAEAGRYKPWQPVEEKRGALEAARRAEDLRKAAALSFAESLKLLQAALVQEEDNAAARAALAELWKERLESAERAGEKVEAAYALTMVERHDDGALAEFVKGEGVLELASEPAGAEVTLSRYEERDGLLVAGPPRLLGRTPLAPVPLAMGSYLCILRKEGHPDVRYPVHIARKRRWSGRVRLRREAEIGEGFVYVPGGPFVYGEGKEARMLELPDFAIARYPVTFAEYAQFLDALDDSEAAERTPRTRGSDGPYLERGADGLFRALPVIVEGPAWDWSLARHGEGFLDRIPVIGVRWEDAQAYCRWKAEASGLPWRLPTEQELEKAARGVDGRRFPWGDLEDASLAKCATSREVNAQPEPVGAFPNAESVYGMGDAAGGVWDWTDSWFDEANSLRALRGGSWNDHPAALRAAARNRNAPRSRSTLVGFRCARGL